jgi:hypothetical protein
VFFSIHFLANQSREIHCIGSATQVFHNHDCTRLTQTREKAPADTNEDRSRRKVLKHHGLCSTTPGKSVLAPPRMLLLI